MRPPLPRRTKDLPAYLQEFPIVPGPGALAVLIEEAGAQLMQLEPEKRALWPDLWPGQQDVTFDILMSILSDAAAFYRRFVAFVQEADAAAPPLPLPPRKRGAKKGRQTYFGLILSDYFKRIGGSPLDDVVSAITGVVFDDASGGPGSDKVRGRRRSARGRKADQT